MAPKKPFAIKKGLLPKKSERVAKNILPSCIIRGMAAKTKPIMTMSMRLSFIINGITTPKTPLTKEWKNWMRRTVLMGRRKLQPPI